nr:type I-C CRISPR-associated protein Cas8c/Csd1 [Polymorphobacter sp.]
MTVLQSLSGYYDRMAARGEAEPLGFSREKFGWCVVLSADGAPVDVVDLHDQTGKKPVARLLDVPAGVKRTVAVLPNLFWDKTAYALGRTAGSGKRTLEEHSAFRAANLAAVSGSDDPGLAAYRRFLETWSPERFDASPFEVAMLDANILFRLDGDRGFLHERPAALVVVNARAGGGSDATTCLVTGVMLPTARLHRSIKGVEGAQTAGAALVSFNLDAFTSYGRTQGANAPVSEAAAFRYAAALNRLLDRGSVNRLRIGDMTVAFWADAGGGEGPAAAAESLFAEIFTPPPPTDAQEARVLSDALAKLAVGRPVSDLRADVDPATRLNVLGLSPNAARLSVRLWLSEGIGTLAARLARHYDDLRVEPLPWRAEPAVRWLLVRTVAAFGKFENVPPMLAGEVTRSVLTGAPYPQSLLAAAIIRLRAGDDPGTGWHAAVIKACLNRRARARHHPQPPPPKEIVPVSLEREHPHSAYQLGRLFAVYEVAQRAALGRGVNSTIRDKYFGAAAASPASVFPLLIGNAQNHLARVRKDRPGWAVLIEREIDEIVGHLPPAFERSLRLEDQGRFAIGYYHQRATKIGGKLAVDEIAAAATNDEGDTFHD